MSQKYITCLLLSAALFICASQVVSGTIGKVYFYPGSYLKNEYLNSTITFSISASIDYVQVSPYGILMYNVTTSLRICPKINYTSSNSTADITSFCYTPPEEGGGGTTEENNTFDSGELCNLSYDFLKNNSFNETSNDTSVYNDFKNRLIDLWGAKINETIIKEYLRNLSSYCPDLFNETVPPGVTPIEFNKRWLVFLIIVVTFVIVSLLLLLDKKHISLAVLLKKRKKDSKDAKDS